MYVKSYFRFFYKKYSRVKDGAMKRQILAKNISYSTSLKKNIRYGFPIPQREIRVSGFPVHRGSRV
jgi:hypothetical protein